MLSKVFHNYFLSFSSVVQLCEVFKKVIGADGFEAERCRMKHSLSNAHDKVKYFNLVVLRCFSDYGKDKFQTSCRATHLSSSFNQQYHYFPLWLPLPCVEVRFFFLPWLRH